MSYYLYLPFYIILKLLLKGLVDSVTTRHSFYFKKVSFGVSDIDLTLFSESKVTDETRRLVQKRAKLSKLLVPIMGEINLIEGESLLRLGTLINRYEGARDPLIKKKVKLSEGNKEDQKNLFLIRIIESDKKNLSKSLEKRFKKLSYCIELMEPKRSLERSDLSTLEKFKNYLSENILAKDEQLILDYIDYVLVGTLSGSEELLQLRNCVHINWDDFTKIKNEKHISQGLIVECVKWELWGLYTYLPFIKDYNEALSHVIVLNDVLSSLTNEYQEQVDYLSELLNEKI